MKFNTDLIYKRGIYYPYNSLVPAYIFSIGEQEMVFFLKNETRYFVHFVEDEYVGWARCPGKECPFCPDQKPAEYRFYGAYIYGYGFAVVPICSSLWRQINNYNCPKSDTCFMKVTIVKSRTGKFIVPKVELVHHSKLKYELSSLDKINLDEKLSSPGEIFPFLTKEMILHRLGLSNSKKGWK